MGLCRISCLLFMYFLTSLGASDFKNLKQSKDIFLSFNSLQELSELSTNEDLLEEIKELEPNIVYYLHVEQIPDWVNFIVLQTHVYLHNVTLGYNIEKVPNKFVTGQNIGLVHNVSTTGTAQFFLENDNPFNVTVLLAVVLYNKSAPVPGGCNMEFEVETAPWMRVNVTGPMVLVSSQPARGPPSWGVVGACELPALQYQVYHLYLPEKDFLMGTYFDFIRRMITVKRIIENGRKVSDSFSGGNMRHVFSAYHGTGSVYALVVSVNAAQYSAYVPALTYTCNPAHYTDSCQVLTSTFSRSLCALVLFIGLFVCLFGHSFFQTELFLMSTLMGSILTYIIVAPNGLADSTNVLLSTLGGVTIGNFWLALWWACGSPMLSILVATLALGYLLTSVAFYTVLADMPYWESDGNYWLAFVFGILVVAMLFAPQTNRVNILACCTVGSYAAIVPIDHYVGANLKYIFINSIRRATVLGFNQAIIDPPFQTKDIILAGMWVLLAITGYVLQSMRFGDRPSFPPSAHPWTSSSSNVPILSEERPLLYGQAATSPGSDSVFS